MANPKKQTTPVEEGLDLDEALDFDAVARRLVKSPPQHKPGPDKGAANPSADNPNE